MHSELGIDSNILVADRIAALVGEGVQFFASTDHDLFTDYSQIIANLDAEGLITSSIGNEVSFLFAHFNCLGCTATQCNYLEAPWMIINENYEIAGVYPPPQMWDYLRENHSAAIIQINHPREGTGYFDAVDYDPAVGPSSAAPELFGLNFDCIEVWNANDGWNHLAGKTLPDWYGFLNRGIARFATGNSDSHALTQWIGQPRNLVMADSAGEDDFYGGLSAFRSQVTSAPFIEFSIDDVTLGSTVVPSGETTASIRVSVPYWAPLTHVLLVANGEPLEEWDVEPSTEVVRFEVTRAIEPEKDTWYHVVARAEGASLAPLYPGRPSMAFTNPIWVDLAGDGFDPPVSP